MLAFRVRIEALRTSKYILPSTGVPYGYFYSILAPEAWARYRKAAKTPQPDRTELDPEVRRNRNRIDILQEFQKMIDEYNSGASNIETWFAKLTAFVQKLSEEEKRGISEQLTEEELVIFVATLDT
jgi:hypothetical protein